MAIHFETLTRFGTYEINQKFDFTSDSQLGEGKLLFEKRKCTPDISSQPGIQAVRHLHSSGLLEAIRMAGSELIPEELRVFYDVVPKVMENSLIAVYPVGEQRIELSDFNNYRENRERMKISFHDDFYRFAFPRTDFEVYKTGKGFRAKYGEILGFDNAIAQQNLGFEIK